MLNLLLYLQSLVLQYIQLYIKYINLLMNIKTVESE
jgi:hypothetical protein